ncbi:uncharacterized protein LOC143216054 [Lasioglossum baleicum]|uniref:uncharacterized protein LOC143216054 n=1 Tax=Lasioglossum baleicum TaxID=434251 RepID=UPI003FCD6307
MMRSTGPVLTYRAFSRENNSGGQLIGRSLIFPRGAVYYPKKLWHRCVPRETMNTPFHRPRSMKETPGSEKSKIRLWPRLLLISGTRISASDTTHRAIHPSFCCVPFDGSSINPSLLIGTHDNARLQYWKDNEGHW